MLANEEFLKSAQLEKADLEKAKADLDTNKTEMLNVLQNDLKFNVLEVTGAIKDKYLVYQGGKFGVDIADKESGINAKIGMSFTSQYSEMDKEVKFDELPTDAITMDQLTEMFGGAAGL